MGMLSVPEFKEQKKKLGEETGTGREIAAWSKGPTRDGCQSTEPAPASAPGSSALSPFSLALESSQGFSLGADSSPIS